MDYSLPGPNGLEVIRRLGSRGLFPPIVMVTGSGDERIAVEAMKLGAKDYVVADKDGSYLDLVPRVVERIISERNQKKKSEGAAPAAAETEARQQALFEDLPIGLYGSSPDGRFIDANPALLKTLGVPDRETLSGMNALDFYKDAEDRNRWKDLMEQRGTVKRHEVEAVRFDGAPVWLEDSSRTIRDSRGKTLYYEGSLQNISARKKTEEEFRRMLMANSVLAELSKKLLAPGSVESIARLVLEKAKSLTGSRLGYVSYVDPHTGHHICGRRPGRWPSISGSRRRKAWSEKSAGSGNGPWRQRGPC